MGDGAFGASGGKHGAVASRRCDPTENPRTRPTRVSQSHKSATPKSTTVLDYRFKKKSTTAPRRRSHRNCAWAVLRELLADLLPQLKITPFFFAWPNPSPAGSVARPNIFPFLCVPEFPSGPLDCAARVTASNDAAGLTGATGLE
jgi:hypothetical protein